MRVSNINANPRTTCGNIRSDEKECAMKAFILERNGEPTDVLGIRDLPHPVPGPGEVLVRTRLSSITQPTFTCPVDVSDVSPRRL
jgi:hypothetical protein